MLTLQTLSMQRKSLVINLAVGLGGLALGWLLFGGTSFGGTFDNVNNPVFRNGLRAGSSQTQVIDRSANLLTNVSSTGASNFGSIAIDGGAAIAESNCATATWNPGSVSTSTITNATSTDIALSGAAMGDYCFGSLTSATSSAVRIGCAISGAATATIAVTNLGTTNAAVDLATGTARVCYFGY